MGDRLGRPQGAVSFCGIRSAHRPRPLAQSTHHIICGWSAANKDTVTHLAPSRGHCEAFSSTIPPLQVALSFACSVASLSHSPSFQLPGWHRLHGGSLADYLLGWGRASTCTAGRAGLQCASMPKLPCGPQELPPSNQVVAQLAPVAWFSCGVGMVPERCPCRYDATILADGHTASNAPDLF